MFPLKEGIFTCTFVLLLSIGCGIFRCLVCWRNLGCLLRNQDSGCKLSRTCHTDVYTQGTHCIQTWKHIKHIVYRYRRTRNKLYTDMNTHRTYCIQIRMHKEHIIYRRGHTRNTLYTNIDAQGTHCIQTWTHKENIVYRHGHTRNILYTEVNTQWTHGHIVNRHGPVMSETSFYYRDRDWDFWKPSLDIETGIETFDNLVLISRLVSRLLELQSWYRDWYWDY